MAGEALDTYKDEVALEQTEARQRLEELKRQKLAEDGPWKLEHFSAPAEAMRCEHKFLRKIVLGGPSEYWCDDCEFMMHLPQSYAMPKQHVVAHSMMRLTWMLKYDGPEAVAMGLLRPHLRLDKDGHPSEAPAALLAEWSKDWERVGEIVRGYIAQLPGGTENGHALPEGQANETPGS
jgi:hypothetical protein